MLIPYHLYDRPDQYLVTGGFVFQQLTGDYLRPLGRQLVLQRPRHISAACGTSRPTSPTTSIARSSSYRWPCRYRTIAVITALRQLVVDSVNDREISSIADVAEALSMPLDEPFDVVRFANQNPVLVIPRDGRDLLDAFISATYGADPLMNIR